MQHDEELEVVASVFDLDSQQVLNSLPGLKEFIVEPIEIPHELILNEVSATQKSVTTALSEIDAIVSMRHWSHPLIHWVYI